ncbi:MAG: aminotransferase class I/II-fold pyridoxal phosphate-dependent enzyme, partial [Phycisphaerae bacterium]
LLCGTLDLHKRLASQLAQFFRREAALLFPTGYQAQLGVISALAGPRDVVFSDRHNHASLVDGCRLAPARVRKYRHADMADLERLLARTDPGNGKLIVTDGVFSMAGALAPLQDIVKLARTYQAAVLLDDAHGLGVLGDTGRGTAERFAVESEVDVIAGTFSKSLASAGGFVVGDEEVIHYLKHHARPCIFSASIPPASVAAALAALDIIEQEPDRRTRLRKNTCYTVDNLRALGYETGNSETPIIPVILRERMKTAVFAQSLLEQGVFANPIISPAVASGQELIRISFTADHTKDQLDTVLGAFCSVGRDLGVI